MQGCRKSGGGDGGGYIPPNNLTAVSSPTIWVWFSPASPPIIWLWCASECRFVLEFGEKKCSISGEDLFFWSSPEFGEKSVPFLVETFLFFVFTYFSRLKKVVVEVHPPPTLKIGQNRGKIANYPPNAQQRFAPLAVWVIDLQKLLANRETDCIPPPNRNPLTNSFWLSDLQEVSITA